MEIDIYYILLWYWLHSFEFYGLLVLWSINIENSSSSFCNCSTSDNRPGLTACLSTAGFQVERRKKYIKLQFKKKKSMFIFSRQKFDKQPRWFHYSWLQRQTVAGCFQIVKLSYLCCIKESSFKRAWWKL